MPTMHILKSILKFLTGGAAALGDASRGEYRSRNKQLEQLRREFMEDRPATDREKLHSDRKALCGDMTNAWNKLTLTTNG